MKAINADGMSDRSRFLNVETPEAPDTTGTTLPAAPTGLTASSDPDDGVTLTWDDPGDDSITGYRILRGAAADSLEALVEDTGNTGASYVDATTAPETTYFYAVKALNSHGAGPASAAVEIVSPPLPPPTLTIIEPETAEQSDATLISNLDQTTDSVGGFMLIGVTMPGADVGKAQSFTTGPSPSGYTLSGVQLNTTLSSNFHGTVNASIHSDSGGRRGHSSTR